MSQPSKPTRAGPARRDRLIQEHEHDTYKLRGKLPDPTACSECGAMYRDGRWTWGAPPADAHHTVCPACQRIRDDYPAGDLTLSGGFLRDHRDEILALARHVEERQKQEHPLKRIMAVADEGDSVRITTTSPQLARSIGEALHRAYAGELDYRYPEDEARIRVTWSR